MRVGYLTYGLDRAPTGIGRYAVELLHALAALPDGPEIVLLTTEHEDRHGLWGRFEHHPLPGCRSLPALLAFGSPLLQQAARRYQLDVVHDPNGIAPFWGPAGGACRVVTIYDAFAYIYPEAHNWLDNWRYRWHLPVAARRADRVLTTSACSQRDIVRYLGLADDKVHVARAGVDGRFRHLPNSSERRATLARYGIETPYILYVGGINPRKNIARLFEAFARVRATHSAVTLVVGGKRQWHASEIDAAFRRLNLDNSVRFTGYVQDADLPALYSAAELFVFPSLYEGFGLPPLEAMACGTAVVTSNVSSLPEVVGTAALTVDPYDVVALAAAMQRLLSDAGLRASLEALGYGQAARFTWGQAASETAAVYRQVLGQDHEGSRSLWTLTARR